MQRHAILDISCRTLWGRSFLEAVAAKAEDSVDEWVKTLDCPVLRVDGTRPVGKTWRSLRDSWNASSPNTTSPAPPRFWHTPRRP